MRRLAGLERFTALGTAHFSSCFSVVAMLEVDGPITLEGLKGAAAALQREYEVLRVEVAPLPGGHFEFVPSAARPSVDAIEGRGPESWRVVWNELTQTSPEGLPWRLVWVRTPGASVSQLLVSCHHCIFDIHSASLFFSGLLAHLQAEREGAPRARPEVPLSEALPKLVGARWPVAGLLRLAWERYGRGVRGLPLEPAGANGAPRQWHSLFRELSRDQTARLLERCRAEQVTVGHALSAALLAQVAERVRSARGQARANVALTTTMDMRRHAGGDHAHCMGMLVGAMHTYYQTAHGDSVWALARAVKAELAGAIARDEHRDFIRLYDLLGPAAARWLAGQNQGRPPESNLVVSNFGQLDDFGRGAFRARRFFITAAQSLFGAALLLACGTLDGALQLHLGYAHPSVADDTALAVLEAALAELGVGAELDAARGSGQDLLSATP
jgi:hypothetical protein